METIGLSNRSDVSDGQRSSDALIGLIRKLRWIGMDDEVERVQTTLAARDLGRADSVVAYASETD